MTNDEIMYITETPAEREAYDALEALARKWQAVQEPAPFELTRRLPSLDASEAVFKAKVHPRAVARRAARQPKPSLWTRVSEALNGLFTKLELA